MPNNLISMMKLKLPKSVINGEPMIWRKLARRFVFFFFTALPFIFQITDTSQDERDDLKDADVNGLVAPAQQAKPQIKIKRDDINYFMESFAVDKATAESLLIENGGDLYQTMLAFVGYNEMPDGVSLDQLSNTL